MYSTYNEEKSVIAVRFTRTLKSQIYKHMTAVSKSLYFDVLNDIVDKYNNTFQITIKIKPIDVQSDAYLQYNKDSNEKDSKVKIGDHVSISKYENIFAKGYTQNWSEEFFVISKIKNTFPWTYVISDLNGEEIFRIFDEKELRKTNQKEFRIEKVIKRKDDVLYVKWEGYDVSLNSWNDEKEIV